MNSVLLTCLELETTVDRRVGYKFIQEHRSIEINLLPQYDNQSIAECR